MLIDFTHHMKRRLGYIIMEFMSVRTEPQFTSFATEKYTAFGKAF